jgi:hypothetical protein
MCQSKWEEILKEVEANLAMAGSLEPLVEQAIQDLLNLIESLVADIKSLREKVKFLQAQLADKKKPKTTDPGDADNPDDPKKPAKKNPKHSSEARRRKVEPPIDATTSDRRTFKDVTIHEVHECPVDPEILPADAQRCADEPVVIQGIKIEPHNIQFNRQVYYSPSEGRYYRGPLPAGYGPGDFSPELQSLIVSFKYIGGMSEPKIRELLENFQVDISAGSISNILTNTAEQFEGEFQEMYRAGLASTPYQQTDDTAARVKGESWHTHIVCNPFYSAYFTRRRKDRLTVVSVLEDRVLLDFRFNGETRQLLDDLGVPAKWRERVAQLGEDITLDSAAMTEQLDTWFGKDRGGRSRDQIEQAAAIVYYRHQTEFPVAHILVCDDASQFDRITETLAGCWVHDGRHYEKLTPLVSRHEVVLEQFLEQYWKFYAELIRYRAGPSPAEAARLRTAFDELFATQTGYAELDDRIAKTAAKKDPLLVVLDHPEVPLHNNAAELGARVCARRRDVSLHSVSERGARAMDIFTSLVQTCKKLGLSAYAYFRDRLSCRHELPSLADAIRSAAAAAAVATH